MTKICYLCPDLGIPIDGQKGASSHIRGFVKAMQSKGYEIVIVTSCPIAEGTVDAPVFVIPKPKLIDGIIKDEDPRTFRALKHVFYNQTIESFLNEIIDREAPDIIYERYSPFSVAGGIVSKQRGIRHFLEVNAPLAEQGKKYRKQSLQEASELLEKTAFFNAGVIIVLTTQLKEWLESIGIPSEKIFVRPCGVDINAFNPEGDSYREQFKSKIVLGFVGSLKPWHDIELLVSIFKKLQSDPRYHLLVVGDGPMRKVIQGLKEEFPDRVTWTGAIEQYEVPKYIRSMDIALSPYPKMDLFYFSPLKVYEYMAMARATVATAIGQLNELIRHNYNGILIPVDNCNAWVEAIEYLASNATIRERLGQNAMEEIRSKHCWQSRASTFIDIIEKSETALRS